MRVLSVKECGHVSGGLSVPEDVQREMEQAYQNGLSRGLSHEEALSACGELGKTDSLTGKYAQGVGLSAELICKAAVDNYIKYRAGTAPQVCELDGGKWNSSTAECIY